jgi:hypothetical protein
MLEKTYVLLLDLSLWKDKAGQSLSPNRRIGIPYLLLRSKVVDNVEELPDFLRCLALDHVSNGLAAHIAVENIRDVKMHHP